MEKKRKVKIIDPPTGWLYGFPAIIPQEVMDGNKELKDWLIEYGYPEEDIELALKYSRTWFDEV